MIEYIVLLTNTNQEAYEINEQVRRFTTRQFKMEAIPRGRAICGLRHGPSRPTLIVDYITEREGVQFEAWFANCIKPMLGSARYIDESREGF